MKKITVRLNSEVTAPFKLIGTVLTLALTFFPLLLLALVGNAFNLDLYQFLSVSLISFILFGAYSSALFFYSRFSPIKWLRLRKKLILFTEQLTKQTQDGKFMHSVEWHYEWKNKNILIKLYSRGLVSDTARLDIQLSEYLKENLLEYKELNNCVSYKFGEFPKRLNGMEVLTNDKL